MFKLFAILKLSCHLPVWSKPGAPWEATTTSIWRFHYSPARWQIAHSNTAFLGCAYLNFCEGLVHEYLGAFSIEFFLRGASVSVSGDIFIKN